MILLVPKKYVNFQTKKYDNLFLSVNGKNDVKIRVVSKC